LEIIKSSTDISELFSYGKRLHTKSVTIIWKERSSVNDARETCQHDQDGRVAVIAGKKLGNAVWRNSAKRRMREICRAIGGPWDGFDVVLLAKGSLMRRSYSDVLCECRTAVSHSPLVVFQGDCNG